MNDLPDYELHDSSDSSVSGVSRTRRIGVAVGVLLLIAAAGLAVYVAFTWRARSAPAPVATSAPPAEAKEPAVLGGQGDTVPLPTLDASDSLVRSLAQTLSSNPTIAAWLATDGLIRNFVVVTANLGDGATPAKHLKVLRPSSAFAVVERDGNPYIDPQSYNRYNAIADAIASVDPAGAAKLYSTLKPLIEEAHRDLQSTDQPFDRTLERAIVMLLNTPILDGPVRLKRLPKGIGYGYDDERLEGLRSAQKQLLRMGPRNGRIVEAKLREIALALGMPAAKLPPR